MLTSHLNAFHAASCTWHFAFALQPAAALRRMRLWRLRAERLWQLRAAVRLLASFAAGI
jgi:hypothetical protein